MDNQRFENTHKMLMEKQMEGFAFPDIKMHSETIVRLGVFALREDKYTSGTENVGINTYTLKLDL